MKRKNLIGKRGAVIRLFLLLLLAGSLAACSGGGSKKRKMAQIAVWEDQGWTANGELTKLLFDRKADVRQRAALALGRVNDTLTLDSLGIVLKTDSDPAVRAMAAFAIGIDKWRKGGTILLEALSGEQDPTVLVEILQACARAYTRDSSNRIQSLLRHPDPRVRAQTLITLDLLNRHDNADSVAVLLNDPDRSVRRAALFYLVRAGAPDAAVHAIPFTKDTTVSIRKLAYRVVGSAKGPRADSTLLAGLHDPDPAVRAAVAEAFSARTDTILILKVFPFLDSERDPRVLLRLIQSVAEHWRISAQPYLQRLLHNADEGVRAAAVKALARRLDFAFLDLIAPAVSDPAPRVRIAYLETLDEMSRYTKLDTAVFMPRVRSLFSDTIPRVRARAVQTYVTYGGNDWAKYLNRLYHDPDPYCLQMAVNIIGGFRVLFYQDSLHALYQKHQEEWRPELKWSILASTANLSPSVRATPVRRDIFNWGMKDPNRLVRWYTIAVWEKFREDHRRELGIYKTDLTVENVEKLLHPHPGNPTARLQTTQGPITIELRADLAPRTVRRFIELARTGIYDACPMNDIQPGNIVHSGDRRGDGWALPGETVRDELSPERIQAGSVIWLINSRDSGHGAFAIALDRLPYLDWRYGVFGRVVDGLDHVADLTYADSIRTVEILDTGT